MKRACVKSLTLRLSNRDSEPKPNKSLKEIFEWMGRCFAETEEIEITNDHDKSLLMSLTRSYICIEPLLPQLSYLWSDTGRDIFALFSSKSPLWIAPEAYNDWANGSLNEEMIAVCREKVHSINDTLVIPFIPSQTPTDTHAALSARRRFMRSTG